MGKAIGQGFVMLLIFVLVAQYFLSFEVTIILLVLMMVGAFGMAVNTGDEIDRWRKRGGRRR